MKMFRGRIAHIALVVASVATSAHANLLANPGFETGDFTGWQVGGRYGSTGVGTDGSGIAGVHSLFDPTYINVRSGNYAAFGLVAADYPHYEYLSLSQSVQLTGGRYAAGFFMGNDSPRAFGVDYIAIPAGELAIRVDGVQIGFSIRYPDNAFPPGSTPADMYEFGIYFLAAPGNHGIEYRISGSGSARAGISVDDFYLRRLDNDAEPGRAPEPGTLALLGLGIAGLGASRRFRTS